MTTTVYNPKTRRLNKMDISSRERRARHRALPLQLKIKKQGQGYHVVQHGSVVFRTQRSEKLAIDRLEVFLRGCRIEKLVVTIPH